MPEGDFALIDSLDGYSPLREALRSVADRDNLWAGVPMPLSDIDIIIEPKYPRADELMNLLKKDVPRVEPDDEVRVKNSWWSMKLHADIFVFEEGGKSKVAKRPHMHGFHRQIMTIGCSKAWGIKQEARATHLLGTLVRHHQFKDYLLTGTFLEKSERSGITYMFRKLRPTVAISTGGGETDTPKILCTLCMHPIAYYRDTWAGSMTPTDDVIAHLMMMRGDEHMFWRRSNQHAPWRPEAGL